MNLQKRLASQLYDCSPQRVIFDTNNLEEIKRAITKADVRKLVKQGIITILPVQGTSKYSARKIQKQKRRGRRTGHGSRKGRKNARAEEKRNWINRIRLQRELIQRLHAKGILSNEVYHDIAGKAKGGFFRSLRHLKLYLEEQDIFKK